MMMRHHDAQGRVRRCFASLPRPRVIMLEDGTRVGFYYYYYYYYYPGSTRKFRHIRRSSWAAAPKGHVVTCTRTTSTTS
eukprot:2953709-Rhodomonas_salina.1